MIRELIYNTQYAGYVVGGVIVLLGIATLVGLLRERGRHDEFQPIGKVDPALPRSSPFAVGIANVDLQGPRSAAVPLQEEGDRRG